MKRQGELLFIKITSKEFEEAEKEKLNHRVIAEGETTGHKHELSIGELYEGIGWNNRGKKLMEIPTEGAVLTHPEHKTISFPQGFYEIRTQREYTE